MTPMDLTALMSRRAFVGAATALGLALAIPWRWHRAVEAPVNVRHAMLRDLLRWRDVLPNPGSIRAIGQRYLQAEVDERDPRVLLHRLASADWRGTEYPNAAALRSRMRDQIRRDFGDGHIIVLDGWILSRTECRLCALATLL